MLILGLAPTVEELLLQSLRFNMRFAGRWAMVLTICLASALRADDADTLKNAVDLFNQGNYVAAQEALVAIDRASLAADDQKLRDDYLARSQVAIMMSEKAGRDLEDADTALADGDKDEARRLLDNVIANEYATSGHRRVANDRLSGLGAATAATPVAVQAAPPARTMDGQKARSLTQEGDALAQAARYDDARQRYEEALRVVPGYPEAVEGLRRVEEFQRTMAGQRGESLIDRARRESQINWQRTVSEYRDVERLIREHVAGERYDDADQLLTRARQIVEAGKQYADTVTDYESLRDELDTFSQWVANEERFFNARKVEEQQRAVELQRQEHLREVEQRRAQQVEALMAQAQQHRKDGDIDAAINVLKQVIMIDPKYKPARWQMDAWEEIREYTRGREYRDDLYKQQQRSLNDVEEAKIPWHEEIRYPKNWPELISRPDRARRGEDRRTGQLFGALDKASPVDFTGDPFDQVIERLTDAHHLNIIVNWNDLKRAGVDRTTPIELSLPQEITLKKTLTEVLDQAGGGVVDLGFDVADGAIKIATRAALDRETYTATYDINDLLMEIPMFGDAPVTDLTRVNQRAASAESRSSEQPWRQHDGDEDESEDDPEQTGRVREILDLIQDTISPDSWYSRGGSIGSIREFNGQLVVTQNSAAQRQIGDLLGKLRQQRAIQIAVEARFITVTSNYLEEMGLDIDVVLNSGNAGFDFVPNGSSVLTDPVLGNAVLLPRTFSRLGFSPNSPAQGAALGQAGNLNPVPQPYGNPAVIPRSAGGGGRQGTPVPVVNQVSAFTDPASIGSDISGSFAGNTIGPAFSLFGSFLDNIQVDFLIRATQADSRSTVLTAPRLVLFNGQRSWVAVTVQQNFVSQLNPVVGQGAVAQAPQTGTIDAGAVLDVTASVSSDRRYVTMTIRPGVTRLLDLQTIPFSGGGAGGGFGGGTALNAFIQLPQLQSQRLQTTVSVPDGGTLLIGGQKLASETEIEAGVPILSKIPVLKRLYSSRTLVKDEQTLLILVKPKVFILTEQEQLAFPSFGPN